MFDTSGGTEAAPSASVVRCPWLCIGERVCRVVERKEGVEVEVEVGERKW
jgi:hypothetical protein